MNSPCIKLALLTVVLLSSFAARPASPETGLYQVPVADELKAFADFQVNFVSSKPAENPTTLRFQLPKELIGTAGYYTIRKLSETSNRWSGPNASGTCDQREHVIRCTLRFHDLVMDLSEVEKAINAMPKSPGEKMNRLQVATSFMAEPIGILTYQLDSAPKP